MSASANMGSSGGKGLVFSFTFKFSDRYIQLAKQGGQVLNPTVIRDVIANALGQGWKLARGNAPRDTGFLMDHIFAYMTDNFTGWLASEAEYSQAVEKGYSAKNGQFVSGRPFMAPALAQTKKIFFENMKILMDSFIRGQANRLQAAGVTIKSGTPSVARKPTRTGFATQKTVTSKPRRYYYSQVSNTSFRNVQRMGMGRTFKKQRIGGRG